MNTIDQNNDKRIDAAEAMHYGVGIKCAISPDEARCKEFGFDKCGSPETGQFVTFWTVLFSVDWLLL
jgi:hypothetical protein